MSKTVVVLAVPHQLQGPNFMGYVSDPTYSQLVSDFIKGERLDFVFEEARDRGPSTAEDLAKAILGPGHYLNVDLPDRRSLTEEKASGWCPADHFQKIEPGIPRTDMSGRTLMHSRAAKSRGSKRWRLNPSTGVSSSAGRPTISVLRFVSWTLG